MPSRTFIFAPRPYSVAAVSRMTLTSCPAGGTGNRLVLEGGKIAEDGPHAELVEAGGEYALLWNRQTGAYLE